MIALKEEIESMKSLNKKEMREVLNKCWMTHDGMWFYHCMQECGIKKANRINKAAVKSMAMIEIKRIKKALDIEEVKTFDQFKVFMEGVYSILKADFMKFDYSYPKENALHVVMNQCFAYDGIKRIGAIEQYQCGIFERFEGWFQGLSLEYTIYPQVEGCMMHMDGICFRDFRFSFGL